jgi:cytochrome oxidase Cu insertion factor (SCO1/SenC/PrrC family)
MASKKWIGVLFVVLAFVAANAAAAQPARRLTRGDKPLDRPLPQRQANRPKVGDAVPNFTLPDLNGTSVSLSDFRQKAIVVMELGACT